MAPDDAIRSITDMQSHAADILAQATETRCPVIITHNGEEKMVIQDIESYQRQLRSFALLKLVALGRQSVGRRRVRPVREALNVVELRTELRRRQA